MKWAAVAIAMYTAFVLGRVSAGDDCKTTGHFYAGGRYTCAPDTKEQS